MKSKNFFEWIDLKEKLHFRMLQPPYVSEGQIWWASLGENVGFEINGKSRDFTRPVIILKKLSKCFYFVIPLTTQIRNGTWYVPIVHGRVEMNACLHQARSIDYRRLHSKLGYLDDADFEKVKEGFRKLYL